MPNIWAGVWQAAGRGRLLAFLERRRAARHERDYQSHSFGRGVRTLGAVLPVLALAILVFQIRSSADTDAIIAGSGVEPASDLAFDVKEYGGPLAHDEDCLATRCWLKVLPQRSAGPVTLPSGDPLASGAWIIGAESTVAYRTEVPSARLARFGQPVLYLPGVRAKSAVALVDDRIVARTPGGLPLFLKLPEPPARTAGAPVRIEVLLEVGPTSEFQGFIRQELFMGEPLAVFRAHHRLMSRSFPRQAAIVFLLAASTLTFCFFAFFVQQRELFALGAALGALGAAEAARIGLVPFLGTTAYALVFTWHVTFLLWYVLEFTRLNDRTPWRLFGVAALVTAFWAATAATDLAWIKAARFTVLLGLDGCPLVMGGGAFCLGLALYSLNRRRGTSVALAGIATGLYGAYLLAYDLEIWLPVAASSLNEVPPLLATVIWLTTALSALGSLEQRVKQAAEDQLKKQLLEQELAIGSAVQQLFIDAGVRASAGLEVRTVYRPRTFIGGDWLVWRDLGDGRALGVIGDVVGKGVQAGLVVSACDAALRLGVVGAPPGLPPQALLMRLLEQVRDGAFAAALGRAMTATFILAETDGTLHVMSLGHPALIALAPSGARQVGASGPMLMATMNLADVRIVPLVLGPGETVVGFTDGVCDGSRKLQQLLAHLTATQARPLAEIERHFNEMETAGDDFSVILLRRSA